MVEIMESLHRQLEECISNIVMPMETAGVDIISPEVVANMVDTEIDPRNESPPLKTYSSVMHSRQAVRKYLARWRDPVKHAADAENNMGHFSDELQPYYSVAITNEYGERDRVYKQRHLLSRQEREVIAKRMRKSARTLLSHADTLVAEAISRGAA